MLQGVEYQAHLSYTKHKHGQSLVLITQRLNVGKLRNDVIIVSKDVYPFHAPA